MSVHHQNVIRSEIEAVSLFGVRSEDYIRNWLDTAHKNMRHKGFEMTDKIGGGAGGGGCTLHFFIIVQSLA